MREFLADMPVTSGDVPSLAFILWLADLVEYIEALEAQATALEARVTALESP